MSLSPFRLSKARDRYNLFTVFNALSWNFLMGSVITLFIMRLHVSSTFIGLINALLYISFFFLPLGKVLARRFSIVRIFSTAWIGRTLAMTITLAAPFAALAGYRDLALVLTAVGVGVFHVIRGVGLISNNPILSSLSEGPDRGSYMTQIQIINSAAGMFSSFALAVLLGRDPPLVLYAVILFLGIITGVSSGIMVRDIPEPPVEEESGRKKFVHIFREALALPGIKLFVLILFFVVLVSGVSRAFLVVYSREIFNQSDGMVSLYTVFGGLGNLVIGMVIKFLVDRIGAKPIFIICVITGLASMIPIVFFPAGVVNNATSAVLFLSFLFFTMNFGFLGSEGIAQTYFLGLIPLSLMLDMGIIYYFIFGIAGAGGSFAAGLLLDTVSGIGFSNFAAFKILYSVLIALAILVIVMQRRLTPLGALPFRGALEVIFSFRDLKAITLLDKLNRARDSGEEQALLGRLHESPSQLAIKGLLVRARSPRLAIRLEALRAMENLKDLGEDAERALMEDLTGNPYTTAYISARILGDHRISAAIPLLRELTESEDYMLAGEAIVALAHLGDEPFRPYIEALILKTPNPRLKIMGVQAFGIYKSVNSIGVLLDILKSANPPPYLRDEVVLALASILDIQNLFYPVLVRFLELQNSAAVVDTAGNGDAAALALALDEAEAAFEFYRKSGLGHRRDHNNPGLKQLEEHARNIQAVIGTFIRNGDGSAFSRWILDIPGSYSRPAVQTILAEAVLDSELGNLPRLQLLISHWAAHSLRWWIREFHVY
ncbi:MAG: MFS transporter [Treponema sp.]|jgi:HEAT repeat protein|nr:MFS transporter [Treponema sp.]